MKELLRTNDPVRLSWVQAMLASAGIEAVILDTHTSIIEGSIGAIPRRLMVRADDETRPRRAERDRRAGMSLDAALIATSDDTLLGGRVRLRQPLDGYRVAIDPVLLAAAVPAARKTVLDIGCGIGAASLCLAARVPGCRIAGIERERELARLARDNIAANDLAARRSVIAGDLLHRPAALEPGSFTHVMANPPFLERRAPRRRRSRRARRPRSKARPISPLGSISRSPCCATRAC